jgi:hypothetical protein
MGGIHKNDSLAAMVRELRAHGIEEYTIGRGRKHPCLSFVFAGKQHKSFLRTLHAIGTRRIRRGASAAH